MNHYQKLVVIAIRLLGMVAAVLGTWGILYVVLNALFSNPKPPDSVSNLISSLIYTIGGIILWALSKPIASLIGRGL